MANAVIDGYAFGLKPVIEFFYFGRLVDFPGEVADEFGMPFSPLGQSEFMIWRVYRRLALARGSVV